MKHWKKRGFALALALCLLLSLAVFAQAAGNEIFVSASGSDEIGDGTEGNPYATINKAYDKSASGDTIVLLSDIAQSACVSIWHDLTIQSKDGEGPYTVTRQSGFAATSDAARSWYNPAMFEAHPDIAGTTVTFANIILDDNFLHEGTDFSDQPTAPADTSANLTRVQDGIVSLYNDPANTYLCTVILEDGCKLQNFGGMNGVNIEGHSELIMKDGSLITNGGTATSGSASGVYPLSGGKLTMEPGSRITGISGSNAVFANVGTAYINGEIDNCSGTSPLRATHATFEIGPEGNVHDITGNTAAYYDVGASTITVRGKLTDCSGVGLYPSCNSGTSTVYVEDGAEIARCGQIGIQTNLQSPIYINGGSIHDNPIGVNVRKQAVLTMTGGDVEGNGIGINLNNKSTSTARCLIYAGTVENNSRWDYYIETTKTGYLNGSYMYFSDSQLATAPDVGMQTNGKAILPTTDNTELYLGNASAAADTKLAAQVTAINSYSTVLATWFAQVPEKALHLTVADLAAQTDPVYVISYPVDAAGAIADDSEPVIYAVTQDTTDARNPIDVLASAGSANGRAYALFTSPDPMFAVSYESHGGSLVPPEAVPENGKATEPSDPTRRLYRFDGWYTEDTYQTKYDFDTPVTADITLHAKWVPADPQSVDLRKVNITKNVDKDASVSYESITFEFVLEPYAVAPLNGTLAVADMPAIGPLTVTMSGTETVSAVNFPGDVAFPVGGVYTYKVTETDGGAANWTYDDAVLYVDLEIEEEDGNTGNLVLDKVVVHKDGATGEKDSLSFTNTYNPPTDLTVSKTISNFGENPLNQSKIFTYTVTFTAPAAGSAGAITATHSADGALAAPEYGAPYTFTLKHNENVVFGNLAAGTTYTVTEQGEEYYTPSLTLTEGGTAGTKQTGDYAEDLSGSGTVKGTETGQNKAEYENEYSITPPTGLTLHFDMVVILALALLALVGGFFLNRKLRSIRR